MKLHFAIGVLSTGLLTAVCTTTALFTDNTIVRTGGLFGIGAGLLLTATIWQWDRIDSLKDERINLLTQRAETAEQALLHLGTAVIKHGDDRMRERWPNHTQN